MAKKTEDVGARFLREVIDAVDDNERVALDAIAHFVTAVEDALPGGGRRRGARGQTDIVEAGLKMIEQLLGVSNDVARRLTESVRQALPEIEHNLEAIAKKATAKKATAKKATAKKATAKKATAKKATAKKATAKKATAKKATAKKATAKKATAKKATAKKATAKKATAKKATAKKATAKKATATRS